MSTLFSLVPLNRRSVEVLEDIDNRHHVGSIGEGDDSRQVLRILFTTSSAGRTLANIGRQGDIVVRDPNISRLQLSFELEETSLEVMAYDRSSNHSTAFFGSDAQSFRQSQVPRRVLVNRAINQELGFGGPEARRYRFRIVWHCTPTLESTPVLAVRGENPRQARTIDDDAIEIAAPQGAVCTQGISTWTHRRFYNRALLGSGGFGAVFEAVDIDSGQAFAVKRIKRPGAGTRGCLLLQREVDALRNLRHEPHIIALRGAQWAESHLELIMDVQQGSVEDLAAGGAYTNEPMLCNGLLHQMLQALDYLACHDLIHRDVKPENILFKHGPIVKNYIYQLADFGLANNVQQAKSFAGTRKFMAPELAIERYRFKRQTPKIDIWSLFATLVDILNVAAFRETIFAAEEKYISAVHSAATKHPNLKKIKKMAAIDPEERATARDILTEFFGGQGLATKKQDLRVGAEKTAERGPSGVTPSCLKPRNDKVIRKRAEPLKDARRPRSKKTVKPIRWKTSTLRMPGAYSSRQHRDVSHPFPPCP